MYLKSIEIYGFKSFANKIIFKFNNGITGIVGPNGSGKSNVGDAVRWVLGEQSAKQLRGSKMEDVIFSGTELRKPQGSAYVAITLDNSDHSLPIDYNEVTVARRVYRSGESEYLIDGVVSRLKDVNSLFFDTGIGKEGYSIIGQGQIERILSGKPEERRELFDEAAGIVKYKKNKAATEKSLENERANLSRVKDILGELEKQVGPLKEQSETARKYLIFKDELKKLETVEVEEESMRHVLDAFLFCCYTGLRYSDFCQLTPENFIRINGKRWLYFTSIKTGVELRLPLHLLFESKALGILDRYPDIGSFAALPCNSEVNKQLRKLAGLCGIKKRITYHVSRHTCATLLVHQGVAITTVQKLLGHTSVKTTQIYSEVLSSTIVRDLKNVQRKRKKVKMFPDKGLRISDFIDNR